MGNTRYAGFARTPAVRFWGPATAQKQSGTEWASVPLMRQCPPLGNVNKSTKCEQIQHRSAAVTMSIEGGESQTGNRRPEGWYTGIQVVYRYTVRQHMVLRKGGIQVYRIPSACSGFRERAAACSTAVQRTINDCARNCSRGF